MGIAPERRVSVTLRDMVSNEQWLLEHGFRVEVEEEAPDLFWTHLVHRDNPQGRAPKYGRGASAEQSIERARRRYEVEELGEVPE